MLQSRNQSESILKLQLQQKFASEQCNKMLKNTNPDF